MDYIVRVQAHAAQPALVIKGKVSIDKAGDAIGGKIGAVSAYLEKARLQPAGAPFTRTYSFENGVLDFEAGFPLAAAAKSLGELIATELPSANVATTVHMGDQATSENAYNALHAWMKANGKQPAGAPWEVYVADDKMEIFFPIR
jgi:effector-binding domain-containing protein